MNTKSWTEIEQFDEQNVALPGPWLKIVDYISKGKIVKFSAEGQWPYLPGHADQCGPDGFFGLPLPCEQLLVSTSPLGALIGKLGGSSADQKDGMQFAIGRFAMVMVPDKDPCALFITINTIKGARIPALTRLALTVEIADGGG